MPNNLKKSNKPPFLKIDGTIIETLSSLPQREILAFLSFRMNKNGSCRWSVPAISEQLNIPESTVKKALKFLCKENRLKKKLIRSGESFINEFSRGPKWPCGNISRGPNVDFQGAYSVQEKKLKEDKDISIES